MNPIPAHVLNLPAKWRQAAQAMITAEGLALCHDHADELQAALEVDAPNPKPSRTTSGNDPDGGNNSPVFTQPKEALKFLSGRFKFAGVSQDVAVAYAKDIDALLARMDDAGDPTTLINPPQDSLNQASLDSQRLNFLIKTKLAVKQLNDTGLFMVVTGDDYPVTGEEFDTPYEAIDALMASDADFIPR